jgi:hypothetical protein
VKVYVCTGFRGHNPVGSAAVVLAEDAEEAAHILSDELESCGLKQDIYACDLVQVDAASPRAVILCDGDY